jgi:thymidylate synthase (FAD)
MHVIKPNYEIINEPDWDAVIISLEKAIRTCYKSEKKIDAGTADKLIRSIISRGHESTLEHASMSVRFVCDRGVSHEMVRHRLCSFSQESTRYVNYSPEGKNNEGDMQFILPPWLDGTQTEGRYHLAHFDGWEVKRPEHIWLQSMIEANRAYILLIEQGWKPEQARSVLPNSLKTEIVVTTNMRDWRHIFHLRCDKTAHPQMRELMLPLYCELRKKCPALFDSVKFLVADDQMAYWNKQVYTEV